MLEFEKKIMLSELEYVFLKDTLFENNDSVEHTNYYYDTNDFQMNDLGITCRVRESNGIFIPTIKEHCKNGTDCSVEHSYSMNTMQDVFIKEMSLSYQGNMHTFRNVICNQKNQIAIDKNIYLGVVDYELEVEYEYGYEGSAIFELRKIANDLCLANLCVSPEEFLSRIGQNDNKSKRFFARKNDSNKQNICETAQ